MTENKEELLKVLKKWEGYCCCNWSCDSQTPERTSGIPVLIPEEYTVKAMLRNFNG